MPKIINHGVFPGRNPNGKDFVSGTLPYEVVVETGNHLAWIPTDEPQSFPAPNTERFNCVTQAHHNTIENIMIRDIILGRMPKTHQNWLNDNNYFDDNGKINFSERFNSILNGTIWNNSDSSKNGNWVWKVCEDGRTISGLIPAKMLPDIPSMKNAEYYNPSVITNEMKAIGKEFMKRFYLPYEWVNPSATDIQIQLRQAPLMITQPGHETAGVNHKSTVITLNDSYNPFIRDMAYNNITDVMKVLVNYLLINQGATMEILKVTGENTLVVKNAQGKYWDIATPSELYPMVARMLGLDPATSYNEVSRADVNANYGGQLKATLAWVEK